MLFDEPYYLRINQARWSAAERILDSLREQTAVDLKTCLDVGCGPGWFTEKLQGKNFLVEGLEGRSTLVREARSRVPGVVFHQADAESDVETRSLGAYDLVFCFGLLYHTENPFRVIRNLRRLTRHLLLIETVLIPLDAPCAWLVTEGKNDTQGLTYQSLIPTRTCLTNMLVRAGFSNVYEFTGRIDHEDFCETPQRHRRRGMFVATEQSLTLEGCELLPPTPTPKYDFLRPVPE